MDLPSLCAELERLFELEELMDLSRDSLGLDPEFVGGTAAKASFARALTQRSVAYDMVEALCDAIAAARKDVDPGIHEIRARGFRASEELPVGAVLGDYRVDHRLDEDSLSYTYLARPADEPSPEEARDDFDLGRRYEELTGTLSLKAIKGAEGTRYRMRVLRSGATLDRRALQRFLTGNRLIGRVGMPGLPWQLTAGPVGDRIAVLHEHFDGEPLRRRLAQGPLRFDEARPLVHAILEALAALHARRLVHGGLSLDSILIKDVDGMPTAMLVDAGSSYLRASGTADGRSDRLRTLCTPNSVAPELIEGRMPDPRSDVYALGSVIYELLSGQPPFAGGDSVSLLVNHLTRDPQQLSFVAPRGWVSEGLDEWMRALLARDPAHRPQDASQVLDGFEDLSQMSMFPSEFTLPDEEVSRRLSRLLADPLNDEILAAVEAALDQGVNPQRIADGILWTAQELQNLPRPDGKTAQKRLLHRAAMLYEGPARQDQKAEQVYQWLIEMDPEDMPALAALERLRRKLGKHEELVELLLDRRERSDSPEERARALAEIGEIYADELSDRGQALVAYAQAFAELPEEESYVRRVERLAGDDQGRWAEALQSCLDAVNEASVDNKVRLLTQMGHWYTEKVGRPDLGLPCYQQVTALNPAWDAALEGMTKIYRRAQQWPELGMVLTARADVAATPAQARDLRADAAQVLAERMNDLNSARGMYEQILQEDPTHEGATDQLAKIYEQQGDKQAQLGILERRLESVHGAERIDMLLRLADIYEHHLGDLDAAEGRYQMVLSSESNRIEALQGLDRIYGKTDRFRELLDNLERQLQAAVTNRQRIQLYKRIAGLHAEEFVDHAAAAEALENVLDLEATDEEALMGLARHYRSLEHWSDVAIVYERHMDVVEDKARRVQLGLELADILAGKANVPERAVVTYEQVLELDPENATALAALAKLRESSGDADRALEAIEALARKAETPEKKADQYRRAARLLEERGDQAGAMARYKLAIEADPNNREALAQLRGLYVERRDFSAAAALLEKEASEVEGDLERARLHGELALLCRDKLADARRAESAAKRAIELDPSHLGARRLLAELAMERDKFLEAATHFEKVMARRESLPEPERVLVLRGYVRAMAASDKGEQAVSSAEELMQLDPADSETLRLVADVQHEHGDVAASARLYEDLLQRMGDELDPDERASLYARAGDATRQTGNLDRAQQLLEYSIELDNTSPEALRALAQVHHSAERFHDELNTLYLLIDVVSGEDYTKLLIELGDLAAEKLGDNEYAAKNYLSVLAEEPDNRTVLLKLMQLYSKGKDWHRLIEVILKLADLVSDTRQKAKYLNTAAMVSLDELRDSERAKQLFDQVLALDPKLDAAIKGSLKLRRQLGDWEGLKELLKDQIKVASEKKDQRQMLKLMDELAQIYEVRFRRLEQAIAVTKAALEVSPDDLERRERLARLYSLDPRAHFDAALTAHSELLEKEPYKPSIYKSLHKLYDRTQQRDASYCVCQALVVLNQAAPDESSLYRAHHDGAPPSFQSIITNEDWLAYVQHPNCDALLTGVLSLIQGTVVQVRGKPLDQYGYSDGHRIDAANWAAPVMDELNHDAGVLGIKLPPLYQNSNDPNGVTLLAARTPALSLGQPALGLRLRETAFTFDTGRTLAYFRPGMLVRQLVSSNKELRAWLFAAIRLVVPKFPVSPDLKDPVEGAMAALRKAMTADREQALQQLVGKLVQKGASLELKRWLSGVDLTTDRAGFILCDDLQSAITQIRASDPNASTVPHSDRVKHLIRYSVSPEYFKLRARVGIAVS